MSDDLSKNPELKIIQEHLNLQSGNMLLFSNNSELTNYLPSEKLHVFSSPDQTISNKIDNFLSTNTFQAEISKYDQKFDTIIIYDIFEEIKHSELFLQNLNLILSDKGTIICSISNFFHINNVVHLFAGQINSNPLFDKTLRFYDLDTILSLLNKNNLHAIKVNRIKRDFIPHQMNLDETLIPSKLIDIIHTIPDSDTMKYVLILGKGKTISSDNFEFVSQFPKNYLLPKLQEFFEKSLELEKSISDKNKVISGLENSISEQKAYTESALSDKNKVISGLENSITEQKAYTESALSDKDKLIEGYENSVKEQREYIENLEGNIHNLQSELKKFKFWRR